MEIITQQDENQNMPLRGKELEIVVPLFYTNLLSPYRVDDSTLEQWSMTLNRILPELEIHDLEQLMDSFMRGHIEYDNKKGIQNIFTGLEELFPERYEKPRRMVY